MDPLDIPANKCRDAIAEEMGRDKMKNTPSDVAKYIKLFTKNDPHGDFSGYGKTSGVRNVENWRAEFEEKADLGGLPKILWVSQARNHLTGAARDFILATDPKMNWS
jgi:hypothetical protein